LGKNDDLRQAFKAIEKIVIKTGEVTKAENIKADLQRRIKPTAEGAKKKIEKD
jgi:hypothetical protein